VFFGWMRNIRPLVHLRASCGGATRFRFGMTRDGKVYCAETQRRGD